MIRHILLGENNFIETFTLTPTEQTIDVEVSDEKFDEMIQTGYHFYKYENNEFILEQDKLDLELLKEESLELYNWFHINDWKVNKITLGEWEVTDPRFIEYKEQRAIKRARLDEIKNIIGV